MPPEGEVELRRFGDAVRQERQRFGLSQEDFAEVCGVHRTYIGQVERGEKNISFVNVLRIAGALKLKVSRLFELADL